MQANWSLLINILLLLGVVGAIVHLIKSRKQEASVRVYESSKENLSKGLEEPIGFAEDDIIAVRKIQKDPDDLPSEPKPSKTTGPRLGGESRDKDTSPPAATKAPWDLNSPIMVLLVAKDKRQFAGYELLQTVLASGLRFGEGQLFHRHQFPNGQGPVLCSLAAATATGVFDLQNIGGFSVRGLCLYMHASQNPNIDEERFTILLDTARQLSEGLDAQLLDFEQKPLTEERIARYYRLLQVERPVSVA